MITGLLSLFSGGAIGTLLGVIGATLQSFIEYKNKKLEMKRELALKALDIKMLDKEVQHAEKLALIGAQQEVETSADHAFTASMRHDAVLDLGEIKTGKWGSRLLVLVEALRRVTRPAITWYLTAVVTSLAIFMTYKLYEVGVDPDTKSMIELLEHIILAKVTLFCTAGSWWFGSRYLRANFGINNTPVK